MDLSRSLQRRIILKWLLTHGSVDEDVVSGQVVERLLGLLQDACGTVCVPLAEDAVVCREYTHFVVYDSWPSCAEEGVIDTRQPSVTVWGAYRLKVAFSRGVTQRPAQMGTWPVEAFFSQRKVAGRSLGIRGYQAGDRMPLNHGAGTKKIQDIFIDAKVPRAYREMWPLVTLEDQIVWVPGYQVHESVHVDGPDAESIHIKIEQILE